MRKSNLLIILMCGCALLAGCAAIQGVTDTRMGAGGSKASGSAGGTDAAGKAAELPRCPRPMGVITLIEPDMTSFTEIGLASPVPVIRLMVQQSGCFQVADRGAAMRLLKQERELARSGETASDDQMKRQLVTADYIITPSILRQNTDAGRAGGGLGSLLPGLPGVILGGLALSKQEAEVMLAVTNTRTGIQEYAATGAAAKKDLAWGLGGFAGVAGGLGGGYASTDIGKITVAAFLDAYRQIVDHIRGQQDDPLKTQK